MTRSVPALGTLMCRSGLCGSVWILSDDRRRSNASARDPGNPVGTAKFDENPLCSWLPDPYAVFRLLSALICPLNLAPAWFNQSRARDSSLGSYRHREGKQPANNNDSYGGMALIVINLPDVAPPLRARSTLLQVSGHIACLLECTQTRRRSP